jgi:hypothetical protein
VSRHFTNQRIYNFITQVQSFSNSFGSPISLKPPTCCFALQVRGKKSVSFFKSHTPLR